MEERSAGTINTLRSGTSDVPDTSCKVKLVDVALIGDEVQVGADPGLGRMDEAEVAHHIHDPEIFVAGRGLHDLFGWRQFNQGCVLQLGVDGTMSWE